jgi:hypothetical protein
MREGKKQYKKGHNTNPKSEETKEKMRVARLAYLAKRKGGDV